MKKFFRFLISKLFLFNFALAIVITVLLVIGVFFGLKLYTDHGAAYTVPDLSGLQMDEVKKICDEKGFIYRKIDSVYNNDIDKGAVAEQTPEPGFKVKKGHIIYLKTNAFGVEMVAMPQLVGISIRQAQAVLETYGLIAGNLRYVPDIAVNVVLRQYIDGEAIEPNTRIAKGTSIDLVLGLGLSDKKTVVPVLKGLSHKQAGNLLLDEYLNLGAVVFDKTVLNKKDSVQAKIYRQSPRHDTINEVNLGSNIDIYLTTDTTLFSTVVTEDEDLIND